MFREKIIKNIHTNQTPHNKKITPIPTPIHTPRHNIYKIQPLNFKLTN